MSKFVSASLCVALLAISVSVQAQGKVLPNDLSKCRSGSSALVQVTGVKSTSGTLRVQSYRATREDWLQKGRWINRIELPARAGTMTICVPLPDSGSYGIAVRHDVNGNGKTDLSTDGGGMSNNPSINLFNLGRPSFQRTAFAVGNEPQTISIAMRYR